MLPFLQKIAHNMRREDCIALFVLHMIAKSFLPYTNAVLGHICSFDLQITSDLRIPLMSYDFIFFPLIGYYLDQHIDEEVIEKWKAALLIAVITVLGIVTSVFAYKYGCIYGFNEDPVIMYGFEYVTAPILFLLIRRGCLSKENKVVDILSMVGGLSFGIYMLDPVFKTFAFGENIFRAFTSNVLIISFLWIIASVIINGLIAYILTRTKVFKYLLG